MKNFLILILFTLVAAVGCNSENSSKEEFSSNEDLTNEEILSEDTQAMEDSVLILEQNADTLNNEIDKFASEL